MFNAHLVLQGYAQLMTIQPNVKSVGHFRQYQTEARENNQGLWK
ncbi:MAG: thermonuclease family protein [Negativicutes bacterium]|jgi:micrococcal nuclease|nr:thermonuclease family protein [Negativicutes bacterium]